MLSGEVEAHETFIGGRVRTSVLRTAKRKLFHAEVRKHVEAGSALYTGALLSYAGLAGDFATRLLTTP
jgi:hypothetical protein